MRAYNRGRLTNWWTVGILRGDKRVSFCKSSFFLFFIMNFFFPFFVILRDKGTGSSETKKSLNVSLRRSNDFA